MNIYSRTIVFPALACALVMVAAGTLQAQEPDQVTAADLEGAKPRFHAPPDTFKTNPRHAAGRNYATVQGLDSVQVFGGFYSVFGYDPNGFPKTNWSFNMVGNAPELGGTTNFRAPIVPVSLLMLNADGTPRSVNGQLLYYDATQFVSKVLDSPVFQDHEYSSSKTPTQFTDAVQRAEFWQTVGHPPPANRGSWHTLLNAEVKTPRLMLLPKGFYRFALNKDGSCCEFVLVDANKFGELLFPATFPFDGSTIIGAAELAGDITTKDISSFLFPNTYLYLNGDVKDCCVLGFHGADTEPGIPSNGNLPRFYVLNYSSWISPGLFGDSFADVTALSHELAETLNDPFGDNITPWWLAPNKNCQDNLETGDVIEGLPNATFPITVNGFTYHPQNEALLPWFEFQERSTAIDHAYSYPDTSVITALSAVQLAGCK
ncbi:MAG: hypothetical protein JO270_26515 [Acidobacteriaceae bacterium]|nr:hypothetical protein [Acidobacteriaceae bacterium]